MCHDDHTSCSYSAQQCSHPPADGPLHMMLLRLAQEASGQEQTTSLCCTSRLGDKGGFLHFPGTKKTIRLSFTLIKTSQRYLPRGGVLLARANLMSTLVACSLPRVCAPLTLGWSSTSASPGVGSGLHEKEGESLPICL